MLSPKMAIAQAIETKSRWSDHQSSLVRKATIAPAAANMNAVNGLKPSQFESQPKRLLIKSDIKTSLYSNSRCFHSITMQEPTEL